eukprot:981358-Heterocapsa_arctica.AAC.1
MMLEKWGWVLCCCDVSKAFPSIHRQQLDHVTDTCSDAQRVKFIQDRHNHGATMPCAFDDPTHAVCVQASQGDVQEDVPASHQFCFAYDKLQEAMAEDGRTFQA